MKRGAKPGERRQRGRAPGPGRGQGPQTVWLFGLHAVQDALLNPARAKRRLIATLNAQARLAQAIEAAGIEPETSDPRRFSAPLDPQSVHQGAALEVDPLDWGALEDVAAPSADDPAPLVVCLDRVTDPHNVGAVLRSAEVFGSRAVLAPRRHAAPETGALAKSASGALERQPYLRVGNLGDALEALESLGYLRIGLDAGGEAGLGEAMAMARDRPVAIVLGAEGPGLRERTRTLCDVIARIDSATPFGSLNVSNAAAVALYAAATRGK